jgi:hypothetical protein
MTVTRTPGKVYEQSRSGLGKRNSLTPMAANIELERMLGEVADRR